MLSLGTAALHTLNRMLMLPLRGPFDAAAITTAAGCDDGLLQQLLLRQYGQSYNSPLLRPHFGATFAGASALRSHFGAEMEHNRHKQHRDCTFQKSPPAPPTALHRHVQNSTK